MYQCTKNFPNLKDNFRSERKPPQWNGIQPSEEAYEGAIMPNVECKVTCGCHENICQLGKEHACG